MQIIIEIDANDERVFHSSDLAKKCRIHRHLLELLVKLKDNGYYINTLFGRFAFNNESKEVIDIGKPGENCQPDSRLVDSLLIKETKLAIIFTDKKYIVFAKEYFVANQFCHMRKVRPLSIYDVFKNFEELVLKSNRVLLDELYLRKFKKFYGENADPVSCFKNNCNEETKGVAIPLPEEKKDSYETKVGLDNYFLVKYKEDEKEEILNFLKKRGFNCKGGYWGCPWLFINIKYKFYRPGKPGVKFGNIAGEHAITFEEFKIVFNIYEKYTGLDDLVMFETKA